MLGGDDRNDSGGAVDQGGAVDPSAPEAAVGEPEPLVAVAVTFAGSTGPVSGTVEAPGGPGVPFHGWLELMDALEAARGEAGGHA